MASKLRKEIEELQNEIERLTARRDSIIKCRTELTFQYENMLRKLREEREGN